MNYIPQRDSPREQLARVEQQLETLQQKIQELEDENARKDAEITRLQTQNAVTEAEAIKREKETNSAMKNDEIKVLVETVFQLIERGCDKQYLHSQVNNLSKPYANFFRKRVKSVAALRLEAHHLSFSTVSVQHDLEGSKRKLTFITITCTLVTVFLHFS